MTINIEPNKNAAEFIRSKAAATPSVFGSLLPDLRAQAFTVARIADFDILRDLIEAIAKIPEGADWRQTRTEIAAQISPYMDESPDGFSASRNKAELLIRTHAFQAYAVGTHAEQTAVAEALPRGRTVPAARSRARAARKDSTAHARKPPNSSRSASVWLASRCDSAQTLTPTTIG